MVVILQQSTENGRHFISTVVEEGDFNSQGSEILQQTDNTGTIRSDCSRTSTTSSSFSLTSRPSVSEQSAIYKQRIDSLFGRNYIQLGAFQPHLLESNFCIKIEGQTHNNGLLKNRPSPSQIFGNEFRPDKNFILLDHSTEESESLSLDANSKNRRPDGDDSDYQKIMDQNTNLSSIVPDSLNNISPTKNLLAHPVSKSNSKSNNNISYRKHQNVTSVNITSDDSELKHGQIVKPIMSSVCSKDEIFPGEVGAPPSTSTNSSPNADGCTVHHHDHEIPSPLASGSLRLREKDSSRFDSGHSPSSSSSANNGFHGCDLRFPVDYLGSTPVESNTTALEDLQSPLSLLYINYLTGRNILSGDLAITKDGLRFEASKIRLVNSFTTIAVWAAIKFVVHSSNSNTDYPTECAFMPLISDPEGQDKGRLFSPMQEELFRIYRTKFLQSSESNSVPFRNPPIFTCVMREGSYSLDCHAFICRCAEDAIVIAANLYQSLVDKMKNGSPALGTNKEGESGYGTLTRNSPSSSFHHTNHQSPSASSTDPSSPTSLQEPAKLSQLEVYCEKNSSPNGKNQKGDHRVVFSDSESLLIPVRPPRRNNKKKYTGGGSPSERTCKGNLKRFKSEDSVLLKMPQRRISISKGQTIQQIPSHHVNYRPQYVKPVKRVKISTPEEEYSSSSDCLMSESIDQVLDRIINPGGMSFNDLKPPYQQLLLRIALTLTQDQLYQKSKEAMKKYQFSSRTNGIKKKGTKDSTPMENEQSQFLGALLKSFSKIASNKSDTSGAICNGAKKTSSHPPSKLPRKIILKNPTNKAMAISSKKVSSGLSGHCKDEDQFMSFCSGCACDKCSEKCYCSLPSKHKIKLQQDAPLPPPKPKKLQTLKSDSTEGTDEKSSEEAKPGPSRTFDQHAKCGPSIPAPAISSTKVCGYDTDSCAGSEKCYCSLQRIKSNGLKIYNINLDTETSDTDTNSYDLEAFNPQEPTTTLSSSSNLKTVSARSVEIISYLPARRLSYCSSNNGTGSQNGGSVSAHTYQGNIGKGLHATGADVHCINDSSVSPKSNHGSPEGSKSSYYKHNFKRQHGKSPKKCQDTCFHSSATPKGILCNGNNYPHPRCSQVLKTGLKSFCNDHKGYTSQFQKNYSNKRLSNSHHSVFQNGEESIKHHITNGNNRFSRSKEPSLMNDDNCANNDLDSDNVLSMKKTAEIEAMFKDLQLVKPIQEDLNTSSKQLHNTICDEEVTKGNIRLQGLNDLVDFEASLGYLP